MSHLCPYQQGDILPCKDEILSNEQEPDQITSLITKGVDCVSDLFETSVTGFIYAENQIFTELTGGRLNVLVWHF